MRSNIKNAFSKRSVRTASAALVGALLSVSAHAGAREDFNTGFMALVRHDYERSIAYFTDAISSGNLRKSNMAIAYHLRGADYVKTGRYDEAIADFTQALALNPDLATAYNDRAIAFRNKGDLGRAVADYSAAIKLMPNVDSFYLNRGLAYAKGGQWEEAIADYRQALYYKPKLVSALVALGDAHLQMGHNSDAVVAYQQAMREKADLLNVYPGVGKKLTFLGAPASEATIKIASAATKAEAKVSVLGPTLSGRMLVLNDTP